MFVQSLSRERKLRLAKFVRNFREIRQNFRLRYDAVNSFSGLDHATIGLITVYV